MQLKHAATKLHNEIMKAKARERYKTCGQKQRRSQYLKALRVGLTQKPGRALERHGIIYVDGEYRFAEDASENVSTQKY